MKPKFLDKEYLPKNVISITFKTIFPIFPPLMKYVYNYRITIEVSKKTSILVLRYEKKKTLAEKVWFRGHEQVNVTFS